MGFRIIGAIVFSASLVACGGESTSDDAAGGKGGSGGSVGGSGGATGGSGGLGGTNVGGSGAVATGGTAGTAGSAGSAGAPGTCSPEQKALATATPPPIGFAQTPPPSTAPTFVIEVKPALLELAVGAAIVEFRWVGPDLTTAFIEKEIVSVGEKNGWHYVAGASFTALAFSDSGFVHPESIPDAPYYLPKLTFGTECQYPEGGACGQPGANVTLLSLEATTGAGVVTIPNAATTAFMAWQLTNVTSVQFPGYGGESCHLEAYYTGNVTALGPALDTGG